MMLFPFNGKSENKTFNSPLSAHLFLTSNLSDSYKKCWPWTTPPAAWEGGICLCLCSERDRPLREVHFSKVPCSSTGSSAYKQLQCRHVLPSKDGGMPSASLTSGIESALKSHVKESKILNLVFTIVMLGGVKWWQFVATRWFRATEFSGDGLLVSVCKTRGEPSCWGLYGW